MRIILTIFFGVLFGFFIGVSFPTLSLTKFNPSSTLLPEADFSNSYGGNIETLVKPVLNATESPHLNDSSKIWAPSNPRGAERLAPRIIAAESDLYLHRLWGNPNEDLTSTPKYLVTFTVGYDQRNNIDAAVKKFSENFTIVLFHYDGWTTEWGEFEWSKRAIHISAPKQTKWWYAKRFLHPDIVAPYDYIFIWDEDLGVENFDAERYIKLVRKHGLEISQPGIESKTRITWKMTKRRDDFEVHKETDEKPGRCPDPHLPPCAAFIEIMAPVFSRDAWRCVWYMLQNDLVHGWGLDFVLRKCVEPADDKIGVVDSQWVVHQSVPSLRNQGEQYEGKSPWRGVRERCLNEWSMFQDRLAHAERAYFSSTRTGPSKLKSLSLLGLAEPMKPWYLLAILGQVRERCLNVWYMFPHRLAHAKKAYFSSSGTCPSKLKSLKGDLAGFHYHTVDSVQVDSLGSIYTLACH